VSHDGLAIYIEKYLKAKEELWKLKYFTMQKYNLQKKSFKKKPKILQDIFITLLLQLISQVSTQAKISCFKNTHIKIDLLLLLLLLPRGQNPLLATIL
jgi:hypothetical protein